VRSIHRVDLHGHTIGPGAAELRGRQARVIQERTSGAGPRLRERLRGHAAEREPGVHDVDRQPGRELRAAVDDALEAGLARVRDALVDVVERVAVVEVGRVDGVAGLAQLVGEGQEPRRLPLRVMEEQHGRHIDTLGQARSMGGRVAGPALPHALHESRSFRRLGTIRSSATEGAGHDG
jgi:hypothetical protein